MLHKYDEFKKFLLGITYKQVSALLDKDDPDEILSDLLKESVKEGFVEKFMDGIPELLSTHEETTTNK